MSFADRIANREAGVAVIGLGYVGLPLAVRVAGVGLRTWGIDVNTERVDRINKGISDIGDVASATLAPLVEAGTLSAHTDFSVAAEADAVIICVPTPLSKARDPDISYIVKALESLQPHLREGQLFVLESTTYPGFTREVMVPMLEEGGLVAGETMHVAFSPERIDPGNETYGVRNTVKVAGGLTPTCNEMVAALYGTFIDHVHLVSTPDTAEMVKLLENTFRAVNIGLVNEIAVMSAHLGLDVWEVIDAAATKPFGFMPFYPGPGLGGHCIPIDPLYLSWRLRSMNYNARFIELADTINTAMPEHIVTLARDALNDHGKPTRGSRVLMLGVAYKRDIDDYRESPAIEIMELLEKKGAHVDFYDPHVERFREGEVEHVGVANLDELEGYDIAIITTNHTAFDYADICARAKLVLDTRNATRGISNRDNIRTL